MCAAENYIRKSAFVQCSIRESIQDQWTKPHPKTNTQSFIFAKYKQPQSIYPIGTSTIQITTYSTNKSPIHKAPDSLMVSHSKMKIFTLPSTPLNLSFCSEPKEKSQNPSSNKQSCLQYNTAVKQQGKMKVLPVQDFWSRTTLHLIFIRFCGLKQP